MKIAFVYSGEEYLGIEYLSAILRKNGYQTHLIYDPLLFNDYHISSRFLSYLFSFERRVIKEIVNSKADLIAFPVNTGEYKWATQIASIIRNKVKTPIVFGGHHPTCLPEEVIKEDFVDFVIQGEGEYALLELVEYLQGKRNKKEIKNLYYKSDNTVFKNELRPLIEDLDSLPFPDKEIFYQRMNYLSKTYTIITSRGCPYICSYCHNHYLKKLYHGKGRYIRRRSVTNIIQELKEAKAKYKIKEVMFQDEIFTLHPDWLKEFSKLYKEEIKLPYACYIHPNALDEETASLLRDSGCISVNLGIESIDESVREKLLYRFIKQSQIMTALDLLKQNHIYCRAYFVIGLPGQGERELIEIAKFCNEHRFGSPMIFWLHYFPKTAIAESISKGIDYQNKANSKKQINLSGYALGGDVFNTALSKIRFLIILVPLLSKGIVEYIIKKRIYKFFPAHYHLICLRVIESMIKFYNFLFKNNIKKTVPRIAFMPVGEKYKYFMAKKFFDVNLLIR